MTAYASACNGELTQAEHVTALFPHHNGDTTVSGVRNDTFLEYNIQEPGVVSETTVDGDGPFLRLGNQYIFDEFAPPQDLGGRQNISSRNTKHLRSFWDSVPRWLHHGFAHSIREILLAPDSPLLQPGARGFNLRTVRTDHSRRVAGSFLGGQVAVLPTEVPIAIKCHSNDELGRLCSCLAALSELLMRRNLYGMNTGYDLSLLAIAGRPDEDPSSCWNEMPDARRWERHS